MTTKWTGTALAASAWIAVCAYLYAVWPSLAALIEIAGPAPVQPLVQVPRIAFLALGLCAGCGLFLKDRWLRAPLALAIDAVIGAPAFAVIAFLLQPFFTPVE